MAKTFKDDLKKWGASDSKGNAPFDMKELLGVDEDDSDEDEGFREFKKKKGINTHA